MSLQQQFEREGNWLFRWRSYVPLCVFSVLIIAMMHFTYPFNSHFLDTVFDFLCMSIALAGLGVRIATVGFVSDRTSGRNTAGQVADSLNATGMYSVVRHPLYFGNFLIWFGVALFPRIWWCPVIVSLAFMVFYERIMYAEEQFLRQKFGLEFSQWAAKTPAFWPRLSIWRAPELGFSLRAVLRRENSTLLGIVTVFFLLEEIGTVLVEGRYMPDIVWGVLFCTSLVLYAVLRIMKKTGLLRPRRRSS